MTLAGSAAKFKRLGAFLSQLLSGWRGWWDFAGYILFPGLLSFSLIRSCHSILWAYASSTFWRFRLSWWMLVAEAEKLFSTSGVALIAVIHGDKTYFRVGDWSVTSKVITLSDNSYILAPECGKKRAQWKGRPSHATRFSSKFMFWRHLSSCISATRVTWFAAVWAASRPC